MRRSKHDEFLKRLQHEAQLQAELYRSQFLPKQLQGVARIVALYPWQTALLLSGITAVMLEVW